jgi:pimeloyl-ACP methyl ester carboxylesterase
VKAFTWSGANSLAARHEAAKTLAKAVEADLRPLVTHRVVLVGHSHGGNVAVMARDMLRDKLDGRIAVDVASLATPFIHATPAQDTASSRSGPIIVSVLLGFYILLVLAPRIEPVRGALSHVADMLPQAIAPAAFLMLVMLLALTIVIAAAPLSGWRGDEQGKEVTLLARVAKAREERLLSYCPRPHVGEDAPMLVVRGFNDEANMALVIGSLGNFLSN